MRPGAKKDNRCYWVASILFVGFLVLPISPALAGVVFEVEVQVKAESTLTVRGRHADTGRSFQARIVVDGEQPKSLKVGSRLEITLAGDRLEPGKHRIQGRVLDTDDRFRGILHYSGPDG